MEIYFGIYSNKFLLNNPKTLEKRIKAISELLHHFIVLPFDRKAAIKTAQIMGNLQISGHMIDFRDGMIAGISIANSIINLVSSNVKHFKRIPDVTILEYWIKNEWCKSVRKKKKDRILPLVGIEKRCGKNEPI